MARQARTTENLKERIADALLELCSEKPFPEISVSEITDRADVGRATYYRHFSSKEDVVAFKFQTIFESLPVPDPHKVRPGHSDDGATHPRTIDTVEKYFTAYLRHLETNRKVLEQVYAANLDYALFLYLYRDNVAALQDAAVVDRYRAALHSASAFAIVDQWITSGFAESADELATLLARQLFEKHHEHQREGSYCAEGGGCSERAADSEGGGRSPEPNGDAESKQTHHA